jgi:hypothetical protein
MCRCSSTATVRLKETSGKLDSQHPAAAAAQQQQQQQRHRQQL